MGSSCDFDNIKVPNSKKRNIEVFAGIMYEDETENSSDLENEGSKWHFSMGRPLDVQSSRMKSAGAEEAFESLLGKWMKITEESIVSIGRNIFSIIDNSPVSIEFNDCDGVFSIRNEAKHEEIWIFGVRNRGSRFTPSEKLSWAWSQRLWKTAWKKHYGFHLKKQSSSGRFKEKSTRWSGM